MPFPQGCTSAHAAPDRATTCTHEVDLWEAKDVRTGAIVGTQNMELWEVWVTAASSLTIRHGLQVATRAATGVFVTGGGATVSISNPCVGGRILTGGASCSATEQYSSIDPAFVQPNTFMGNQWVETFDLGLNSRITPATVPGSTLLMLVTPTAPPGPIEASPAYLVTDDAWRCDAEVLSVGCVDPLYAPTVVFNTALTPKVRPVALHMRDAQNQLSQHWGKPGSGNPLHRTTDLSWRDRNNAAACANFVSNPPVATSCDEYPFASTQEGGAGASIRAVSLEANKSQGGILVGGYNSWRILDGDAYYVQVIIDDSATEKVMIVGDSISQGLDGDYTWRYRLWQHFQSDGVTDAFVGPRSGTHDLYSGTAEAAGTASAAGRATTTRSGGELHWTRRTSSKG